jgi:hypothetical protein
MAGHRSTVFPPLSGPRIPEEASPAPQVKDSFPVKPSSVKPILTGDNAPRAPIFLFGDLQADLRLIQADLRALPRSSSDYDIRLKFMLSTLDRMQGSVRSLLRDWEGREK